MGGPRAWMAVVVGTVLVAAVAAFAGSTLVTRASEPPAQPIRFPHQWHVESVGAECVFCHRTVTTTDYAGVPAVEQCMFCHQVAGHQSPEVQKLLAAAQENRPIDWIHVYHLPDHVRFTHAPHLQAGIDCGACHGAVEKMTVVRQDRPLKMGDCVGCHRQHSATTDCWTCHY